MDFFGITIRDSSWPLLKCAVDALEDENPMTLRQLFYRVVSAGKLPSTDAKHYRRLANLMTRLREAGGIPRTYIVDHIRATLKPSSWSGLADFGESVRACYRKDFWAAQEHHVEVFVEKDAIAGTLQPITEKYDISLRVCRGYSSISFAGEIGDLWADIKKPIVAYYLGDFDPSGFDIERDLRDKLTRYSDRTFYWERLAVLEGDFDEYDLIRLPVKRADRRSPGFIAEHGDDCAEVDAIPPSELRRRVEDGILSCIDIDEWSRLQRIEELERDVLGGNLKDWAKLNLDKVPAAS